MKRFTKQEPSKTNDEWTNIKIFLIASLVFIVTDMLWSDFIAKNLYFQHNGPWLSLVKGQLKPLWWATLMVYLLLALVLSYSSFH